ncbi:protein of unknown function [Xenorhabdus doucetiae]|uniref:Uncharacterized protein n=1 Tax=Xenorhabdus doucetiae TaxID=351671 RepID=A0A068QWW6_9GAMM|nr:protein of unknown function [Xenorhabdus doucetiae]
MRLNRAIIGAYCLVDTFISVIFLFETLKNVLQLTKPACFTCINPAEILLTIDFINMIYSLCQRIYDLLDWIIIKHNISLLPCC